jgi:hypothetical protein
MTALWSYRDEALARIDLEGFELEANDGLLGKVTQTTGGRDGGYLLVDTSLWRPMGQQLLVPAGLVESVDLDERRVRVKARREQIMSAPAFDASKVLDERSRGVVSEYYGPLMGEPRERPRSRPGGTAPRRSSRARRRASGGSLAQSRRRQRSPGPTRAELYEHARHLGIEGRSKMNKAQLARAVGRRRRSRGGRPSGATANPVEVQAFLEGVGYPVRKGQLLRHAERHGAGRDVRATLRRLPEREFDSPTEVSEAVGRLG